MHKKVYFVGRQSMYKAIEKIASEEFELVFKKEKKSESFEECRNIAENLSQDLIEPVLVEGSMVANQKNTSFLYYIVKVIMEWQEVLQIPILHHHKAGYLLVLYLN